jgi:uncharacterized protein YecE (DUF72 family)
MEFGRLPENELNSIDWSFPRDPAFNKLVLKGKAVKNPKVYIGCAKWGRTEWVGKLYPPKTREKDFLKHYIEHFNSVELNATHYKIYGEAGTRKWAGFAKGKDFVFCPKMYKGVTHFGKLTNKKFILNEFLRGIKGFGEHLGPVFIQVNELFSPKRKQELIEFVDNLPPAPQFFLELRHPGWFSSAEVQLDMFKTLSKLGIGAVITDTAGRRDCAHMHLTIPKTFIRFVGNSLHPTDKPRIDAWVKRIKFWLKNGLKELYFFMHMHDEAKSPELTAYLIEKLGFNGTRIG